MDFARAYSWWRESLGLELTPMATPNGLERRTVRQQVERVRDEARRLWRRAQRSLRRRLTWSWIYGATSYSRSALWIVPFFAIAAVFVAVPILRALDGWIGWRLTDLGLHGAQTLYETVITLNLSFLVFTFGSLLVAIQVAGGQLTPRVIATTLLRDNVVRYSVGLFVFALIFTVRALNRLGDIRQELVTLLIAMLGLASLVTFLFLIDYAARLLRPVSILARIAEEGLRVIKSQYQPLPPDADDSVADDIHIDEGTRRVVYHEGQSGIVLAIDMQALTRLARRARGVVEFVPQVGDFVTPDDPIFILHGGAASIDDAHLRTAVAFGPERTMEQDPLFSFRIMVDIGLKALSPAINDPTTAVLAIDQIHRLLRTVGRQRLHGGPVLDGLGHPRLVHRRPTWQDFVHLSCTEIRAYGASNVQVARRLRAMLENVMATLPAYRHPELLAERGRLDQAIRAAFPLADDLALASIPDSQGLGGSRGNRSSK